MGIWELRFGIWGSGPATRDLGLRIWDLGFGTYTPLEQLTLLINWVWPTSLIFLTFIDHFGMKNISRSIPGLFWLSLTWAVLVLGGIIFHSWLKLSLKSLKSLKSASWKNKLAPIKARNLQKVYFPQNLRPNTGEDLQKVCFALCSLPVPLCSLLHAFLFFTFYFILYSFFFGRAGNH